MPPPIPNPPSAAHPLLYTVTTAAGHVVEIRSHHASREALQVKHAASLSRKPLATTRPAQWVSEGISAERVVS